MTTLVIHLDTSGTWQWKLPDASPEQPACVRVAMLRHSCAPGDANADVRLIHAPGARFEPGAIAAHAITAEATERLGEPAFAVMNRLAAWMAGADRVVAYGLDFHRRVANGTASRAGIALPWPRETVCAMRAAVPIVRVPRQAPGGGFTFPKLRVAAHHFGVSLGDPTGAAIPDGEAIVCAVHAIDAGTRAAA